MVLSVISTIPRVLLDLLVLFWLVNPDVWSDSILRLDPGFVGFRSGFCGIRIRVVWDPDPGLEDPDPVFCCRSVLSLVNFLSSSLII